jgi:hypothetical protein
MSEIGDRINQLCTVLNESDIWTDCEAAGAVESLRLIITMIRNDVPAHTDRIDDELVRALDAFDAAMATAGYGYVTRSSRKYQRVPGTDRARRVDIWVCPAPRPCTRTARTRDAEGAACALTSQALKKIRFSS